MTDKTMKIIVHLKTMQKVGNVELPITIEMETNVKTMQELAEMINDTNTFSDSETVIYSNDVSYITKVSE